MKKRLLAVFAHPDDEAFGPGGSLAKYAAEGVEIYLLSATKGERGQWSRYTGKERDSSRKNKGLAEVREKELLRSAEILGVKKVEFLGYTDGQLGNAIYHELADKIIKRIAEFKPQVILTMDRLGVSGHLDHIAVSMITTFSYLKSKHGKKLYYHVLPKERYNKQLTNYFIYFPEGYDKRDITTRVDYSSFWQTKKKAMMQHKSQTKDVENLLKMFGNWPKIDHFILQFHRGVKVKLPESDLFAGL